MKSLPVGVELFHVDGRTDRLTTIIVAFRNFANAPKNVIACKNAVKNYWNGNVLKFH
jgi:hypothetical protein